LNVANPEDHKSISELFNFAFRTINPLILQAAEKWAGISGYILSEKELKQYAETK
jgi:hypothetical protein